MDKRPFFSVVIPCYNSHKTIVRLLDSLTHQDIDKDDLEVIIVDDYSDYLWYFNILKLFSNLLNIKFIRIEDRNIGYPGPVRELGVLEAIGQYLFFIDHDDRLENSVLHELMNLLSEYKYPEVLFTKIKRINDKPEYRKIPLNINIADEDIIDPKNLNSINYNRHSLLHGVFFNIDKFWKKYDIHFRKDLKTNEDVYILNTTKCILNHINKQPIYGDICTYVWYKNPESLSQTLYTQDNEKVVYLRNII
jgi:glycosyltransferase involved in cell wall biosynthesis